MDAKLILEMLVIMFDGYEYGDDSLVLNQAKAFIVYQAVAPEAMRSAKAYIQGQIDYLNQEPTEESTNG